MSGDKVTLISSDNVMFEVDELVAWESETLRNRMEDSGRETAIPLANVTSMTLVMVIGYCQYHVELQKTSNDTPTVSEDEIKRWFAEFVKADFHTLAELANAACYLKIENLKNLLIQTMADMLKGKSLEELRMTLNITNDFTPEEEEEVRRNNGWAFD